MLLTYSLPPLPSGSATVVANIMEGMDENELVVVGAKNYRIPNDKIRQNAPKVEYISWRTASFKGAGVIRLAQWPISLLLSIYYYKKHRCKSIIAQFPNNEFLILGYILSKITGSNFYPFLHNSFADNKARKGIKKWIFEKVEKTIFSRSSAILTISDGLKEYYDKKYNNRFDIKTIRHSYNEAFGKTEFQQPIRTKTFALVGSINASNLDATIRLIKAIKESVEGAKIYLTSGTPDKYLAQLGLLENGTELTKRFSRNELFDHLHSVDAVLLPHGFEGEISEVEYKTIFPTKTIEYLLSGRPILAHCPSDSFINHFLTKHGCAFIINEKEMDLIKQKLHLFSKDIEIREKIAYNAQNVSKMFHGSLVMQDLRNAIQKQ